MKSLLLASACVPIGVALSACERPATAAAPVAAPVAVLPASSAVADGSIAALMREAFPKWSGQGAVVLHVPSYDHPDERIAIAATPTMAVKIDATHRALVLVGTPSDEAGHDAASHAQGGNLGIRVFELQGGRWVQKTAQDSVMWSGSMGILGDVELVQLGPGHPALSIVSGFTGQGFNVRNLDVVELEPAGARVVLPGIRLSADALGAYAGCDEWLNRHQVPSTEMLGDLNPGNCFEVGGAWHVQQAAGAERGDIVISFDGHRVVVDEHTQAKSVQAVAGTLVYRYGKAGYEKAGGENPVPEV